MYHNWSKHLVYTNSLIDNLGDQYVNIVNKDTR